MARRMIDGYPVGAPIEPDTPDLAATRALAATDDLDQRQGKMAQAVNRIADAIERKGGRRLEARLALQGQLMLGKNWRTLDVEGVAPGDVLALTPRAETPAGIVLADACVAGDGRLRIAVVALVAVTLPKTAIDLDIMVWR